MDVDVDERDTSVEEEADERTPDDSDSEDAAIAWSGGRREPAAFAMCVVGEVLWVGLGASLLTWLPVWLDLCDDRSDGTTGQGALV